MGKISMETMSVFSTAMKRAGIYDMFCDTMSDYFTSNMLEEGRYIKSRPGSYLRDIEVLLGNIESFKKLSPEVMSEGLKELHFIHVNLKETKTSEWRYSADFEDADDDFVKFLLKEFPAIVDSDEIEDYSNTAILGGYMLLLYYFSSLWAITKYEEISERYKNAHFVEVFKSLDYHKDAEDLDMGYKDSKMLGNVLKSLKPIDISHLPEFMLDDYLEYEGKWYLESDVQKAITGMSQAVQALEKQDLEPELTNEATPKTAKEIIEGFKSKRKARIPNVTKPTAES